tara:strand:+ start:160 stop:786 length:627 start_codon:yes stop_codon:yes gene_type:complete
MAKMSLREWINSAQKSKGLSTAEAKKNAGKYKSISSAKKAGSLYYTNKDGKVMIAATATDLNKPSPAKTKVAKPKLKSTTITVTKLDPPKRLTKTGGRGSGSSEVNKRKADPESPSNKLAVKKTLSVNPRNKSNAKKRGTAVRTKNKAQENALSRYTFKQYGDMSVVKRKKLGLPPKLSLTQYMAKALQSDSDFKGTNTKKKKGPSGT